MAMIQASFANAAEFFNSLLDQAISPQDWNTLYLASPEFMRR
jgi:hypothetical protein